MRSPCLQTRKCFIRLFWRKKKNIYIKKRRRHFHKKQFSFIIDRVESQSGELCKGTWERKTTEILSVCCPFKEKHLPHWEKPPPSSVSTCNANRSSKWCSELQVFWGCQVLMRSQTPHCDYTSLVVISQLSEVLTPCYFAWWSHLLLFKMKIKWILMKCYAALRNILVCKQFLIHFPV